MNNDLNDKQLIRVRQRFFDLLKSFFTEEPDAEKMSRWRGTFAALTKEKISPSLDSSIQRLNNLLSDKSLSDLQEEYYQLFVNPFSDHQVTTTASSYLDGRNLGPSLATLRGFLLEVELEKDDKITDSEDSLVMMLDILSTLIEEEKSDPDKARRYQGTLIDQYLGPFGSKFASALKENEKAVFYEACGSFLNGYLDLEKGLTGTTGTHNQ